MNRAKHPMATRYEKHTLLWWKEQRLVTLHPISTTHGVTAPAGTVVTVIGKRSGLEVRTEQCPQCGVSFRVSKVPARSFAFADGYPIEKPPTSTNPSMQ